MEAEPFCRNILLQQRRGSVIPYLSASFKRGVKIEIIPAIDILGGRCVRLLQGDYAQETVYSPDPVGTAMRWQSLGAPRLHVVDLDGAADGESVNFELIREIANSALIPVEVGGGIRSMDTVKKLLTAGVDRVILGTAAVENPELVREICARYADSVAVSIDARNGKVATRGWVNSTEVDALELARSMKKLGVKRFIYTDISRDGTLSEPNFAAIRDLISAINMPVIASGGVSNLSHLRLLKDIGAEGAIVGKAIYTGDLNLKRAFEELS
ncbi:phosphoribosylformimino-5-aminoimidazole carboxamide ribonucleotide (ProFAR) isomerase [Dehalococcoides mccartyi VS]|uniref:1-(5-phosphoribosyl)-5-[(5-phosphoribosylamino)methylideneamino] imidazole-4-carboxamide isomerase n=1 Tax=Dehalococcoides mccartyi (strain VS) TaxID=311424 RepID=D2BIS8_DEHMV|nr:phosphoribosylformimino-5-aminoimidazole carboxamide ribonucleotide (ProFAR) isomerase [Dehalococcoides mccartyi VS]